jgi:iron complex outermembrane recepter protein
MPQVAAGEPAYNVAPDTSPVLFAEFLMSDAFRPAPIASVLTLALLGLSCAHADTAQLAPVSVSASADSAPPTPPAASRLGLSTRELPAPVEVIDRDPIDMLGLRNLIELYRSAPGVTAGNIPGSPASVAMRGFSDVGYLFDGVRAADPALISRNLDTWNFERVEILKGPASVIQGTGALGGTINLVPRQPSLDGARYDAALSLGSHDSTRIGIGTNQVLGPDTALRTDISHARSNGYVDDTASTATALTTSLLWRASDRLSLTTALDVYSDRFRTPYQGTPLLPANVARDPSRVVHSRDGLVLDERLRDNNYNVDNGVMKADSQWLRTRAVYQLNEQWQLINELGVYNARRDWENAEDFTYNSVSGLLDRGTTLISHDHQFISERAYASHTGQLFGLQHRASVGVEYQFSDFASERRFGSTTSVDPFNPARGRLPAVTAANYPTQQDFDSQVQSRALFIEDALNLTPRLLLITGLRYDYIDLDRTVEYPLGAPADRFGRRFEDLAWRVGAVYDLSNSTQLFAQYNRASSPITQFLLSNMARAGFDLSTGRAVEAGLRSSLWQDKATLTTSAFRIRQDDILTRDVNNPSLTVQGGTRETRGVELDLQLQLTPQWQVNANGMLASAEYTRLTDGTGNDLSGNRPTNVPEVLWQLSSQYRLVQVPMTFGAAVQHTGDFYTSDSNQYRVEARTLLDAWIGYPLAGGTLTLRGRNLTDEFYADWSGYSATQVYIGAPRTVELGWTGRF